MKAKHIIYIIAFAFIGLTACDEQKMEWYKDPSHSEVTTSELPLALAEKLSRYEALKSYTDLKLGVGIGLDLYMNEGAYDSLTNANFDEVTVGYAMKHAPMVNSSGEIEFDDVDKFISKVNAAGLSVFGHTLVWHANQDASYLNGLIASSTIPGSSGTNVLDLSGLEDGSFTDWPRNNPGDGITIEEGKGLSSSSNAIKLVANSSASSASDLQLTSPTIAVDSSHTYEISFFIKSDQTGQGRISFSGLNNNTPLKDWYNNGGDPTETFGTTTEWQQVKFTVDDFAGESFSFNFDLGYLPSVTYYIDATYITVVDTDNEANYVNLITNSDFESGSLDPWKGWGSNASNAISGEGEGYGDTGFAMVLTNSTAGEAYSAQQAFEFSSALEKDVTYTCTFMVKASTSATLQVQVQNPDSYAADYFSGISVGTSWTKVEGTITPSADDRTSFIFDFGETAATFYIDDVVLTTGEAATSDPITIEKTDEEKAEIIGEALESWISGMVTHYKDNVHAWDVVNEPMLESGEVRTGDVSDLDDDTFYWVKYLGKDYAVTAFNLARQYGNADDILFVNDYNLESNLTKCQGLIDYVEYIESQGATVDGIGTQMHISTSTDSASIAQMFEMLAGTGKLIKISELDISLGTSSPTTAQLAAQAEMYQYVVDMYLKYIPESQRYGITIWGISDNEDEHQYWLPDQSPNLWDADYERKHAYKGVADGLAGKDISEDFTGELVY